MIWSREGVGVLTFGDGCPSLPLHSQWPDSISATVWVAGCCGADLARRNFSKMAMSRNMEMRMAVATNPNETAFTESSKLVQRSSLSKSGEARNDPAGCGTTTQPLPTPPTLIGWPSVRLEASKFSQAKWDTSFIISWGTVELGNAQLVLSGLDTREEGSLGQRSWS